MGYRKADNNDPVKLVERGARLALRLGRVPGVKNIGSIHKMPSYERLCAVFGTFSAYQSRVKEVLDAMGRGEIELRRGSAKLASPLDYAESCPEDTLGCNYGALLSGPCACQWCEAYKTPARQCTCTSDRDQCAACRAYWVAWNRREHQEAMRTRVNGCTQ